MSLTQRGVRAGGCVTATTGGAFRLARVAHERAAVPRVLGIKPAFSAACRKFQI